LESGRRRRDAVGDSSERDRKQIQEVASAKVFPVVVICCGCNLQRINPASRMVSSGLLRRVALVRTDVSEEPGASFIGVTSNRRTL
jgi:hypothetical protein